jgi:glutathione S-transferase
MVRFDGFDAQSQFKQTLKDINPVGKVPVLVDGDIVVWDTLAIAEYVAEKFPEKKLWPSAVADRARARSICAEMHSGFTGIRSACPMNIDAYLPEIGAVAMRDKEALRQDLKRIDSLFSSLLKQHKGPMLFGEFTIPDAYFAPVVMRIKTYALPVSAETQAYMDRLCAMPGVKAWIDAALAEKDFIAIEEPFRTKP